MVVIIVWLELYVLALLSGALYNALGLLQGDTETSPGIDQSIDTV